MTKDASQSAALGRGWSALLKTAMLLAIIGAINWGLIGFFNWNLVDAIFGGGAQEMTSTGSRVVYAIVGIAGLIAITSLRKLPSASAHQEPRATYTAR
jgi:uncharacterized membrane protein YuzA (DUF378 family)